MSPVSFFRFLRSSSPSSPSRQPLPGFLLPFFHTSQDNAGTTMASTGPRPVRSSSSKSLRTSLTSFPRRFCSSPVFGLQPSYKPPSATPPTLTPGLLLLTGLCRFNLGYGGSCRPGCRARVMLAGEGFVFEMVETSGWGSLGFGLEMLEMLDRGSLGSIFELVDTLGFEGS